MKAVISIVFAAMLTACAVPQPPAVEWTGGGLVSTSRDLARWGTAFFDGAAMSGDGHIGLGNCYGKVFYP